MSLNTTAAIVRLITVALRSDWPTIPQLYVDGEFVGGCDILLSSKYQIMGSLDSADSLCSAPIR